MIENTQLDGKPTPSPAPGLEPRLSECTVCPPWVLRCVHFGGRILVIAATGAPCADTGKVHPKDGNAPPYGVFILLGFEQGTLVAWGDRVVSRSCSCLAGTPAGAPSYFHDLPEAEAEFLLRAELLRAGASQGQEVGA